MNQFDASVEIIERTFADHCVVFREAQMKGWENHSAAPGSSAE
jgi:hypothetical protein